MSDPLRAPLEAIARDLGRLLKCYAREETSATDLLSLLAALREGFDEAPDGPAELRLPLITRNADPEKASEETFLVEGYNHDAAAAFALHLEVGPDYVELKHRPDIDPANGMPVAVPAVTCFVDHDGRLTADLWHADVGDRRRYVLRGADQEN